MKVAFFTDTYKPQINGVVSSIELLKNELVKEGHEVHIFCPEGTRKNKFIHTFSSFKFKNYPEYRIGLPFHEATKQILKIKPDVIHIHSPFSIGTIGLSIAKIMNIPIVATYHTLLSEYFDYIGSNSGKNIAHDYTKWFFDRASIITAPGKSVVDLLRKYGIKKPIKDLPTPLKFQPIKKKNKNKNKNKNKIYIILHVGRLCKEKRIDIILKAFKIISKKIKAKLILTSDGPDKKRLKNLCKRLKISKDVTFTGYIPTKELLKLYSTADVFISASDTETQGLVVLEALAYGCPVVVRNALGFKDYIKDKKNGLLFNNEKDLIKKIITILKNKRLRNRLTKNGYKTVEKFNVSNYGRKMEDIYREALRENKESKIHFKLLYTIFLIFGSIESWFIRNMKISINSRFLNLYLRFFRRIFIFDKLKDII